ncbi:MAG: OmpP1/FadL family transporter, partial [Pirellulaceae bacterium]
MYQRTLPGLVLLATFVMSGVGYGQGIALTGVGAINRSMGGAATAAPIDAAGAIHWNPASISGLASSEVVIGMELLMPTETVSSSLPANAFGPGIPPVALSGTTRGEPGVAPIPTMSIVHKPANSRWTYGLGINGIAGFKVNYPASTTNPILTPQPPAGLGLGPVFADLQIFQVAPTVSYALTDRFSVGFAPTLSLASLTTDPLFFATPNADFRYPSGRGTRYTFGGGFQAGIYYIADSCWRFGATFKSPQWFEDFRFQSAEADGSPRVPKADIDYPMILSFGTAYSGFENLLIALDLRYFDYENTQGFRQTGFAPDGSLSGLGWRSIVSSNLGIQYRVNDHWYLRTGYTYQQNPIQGDVAGFNVASPLVIEHLVAVGTSFNLTHNLILSATYIHGFEGQSSGSYQTPFGAVPGSDVTSKVSADALNT